MSVLIGIILVAIFFFLSAIHFYWGLGGKWGTNASVPTNEDSKRIINPKSFDCFVVATGLLFFGLFILIRVQIIFFSLPLFFQNYGLFIIAGIFLLRAIGEFKYVGFFKKIKNTQFGKLDTKYFTPLCLFIGGMAIILELIN